MTEAYRKENIAIADQKLKEAEAQYARHQKWCAAKSRAADDVEFWSNKLAFLLHAK